MLTDVAKLKEMKLLEEIMYLFVHDFLLFNSLTDNTVYNLCNLSFWFLIVKLYTDVYMLLTRKRIHFYSLFYIFKHILKNN